jgi:hypothetical protein
VAVDLLDQRADRDARDPARARTGAGEPRPSAGLDFRGLVLGGVAALGLVWGLVRGNAAGWGSSEVVVALVGGAAFALAFVVAERRARSPLLPLRLFRSRAFSAGNAATSF